MKRLMLAAVALVTAMSQAAWAELTIRITQGVEGAVPIAIVPMPWEGQGEPPPHDLSRIVHTNLRRSGRFKVLSDGALPERPVTSSQANLGLWRAAGTDYILVGRIRSAADGRYQLESQLLDVFQGSEVERFDYRVSADGLRSLAHFVSDQIYEKLTGQKGAFNTRIAYVTATTEGESSRYSLMVADADGYSPQSILSSPDPLMSPAWSPDGQRLAYVSFETGRPQIFVQEVYTGRRELVTNLPGINGAPSWSPDGSKLAVTLSQDGNPEIYVHELASRRRTRLTNNAAIDTEPAWTPDGRSIVFTSDRGGGPQLYRMSASGGNPTRLTFEGDYNARASVSSDGRTVAMVHRDRGNYRIAVLELESGLFRVLTNGRLDESPSYAPNASMILYATSDQGRGFLEAVSVDGRVRQQLELQAGDVREPAWSPYDR